MEAKGKDRADTITNWFVTIFGSALISAAVFLLATILNYMYSSLNSYRNDSNQAIAIVAADVTKLKERLSAIDEQRMILLEKVTKVQELTNELGQCKERIAGLEASGKADKDRATQLDSLIKELKQELQALREKIAAMEAKK